MTSLASFAGLLSKRGGSRRRRFRSRKNRKSRVRRSRRYRGGGEDPLPGAGSVMTNESMTTRR
jgi:hypothetical protein